MFRGEYINDGVYREFSAIPERRLYVRFNSYFIKLGGVGCTCRGNKQLVQPYFETAASYKAPLISLKSIFFIISEKWQRILHVDGK